MLRLCGLVVVWFLVLVPTTGAAHASPVPYPSPTPAPTPLCVLAATLTKDAKPQQAEDLIRNARSESKDLDSCEDELDAAVEAVTGAFVLIDQAETMSEGSDRDWSAIRERIAAAQALDKEVEDQGDVIEMAKEHPAPEPQTLSRDWLSGLNKAWDSFGEKYLAPVGKFLLAAAGVAILLIALARLILLVPFPRWVFSRSTLASRRLTNAGSYLLLVASGLAAAKVLPDAIKATEVAWDALGLLALLGAAATLLTVYSLATRLRLSVAVAGKTDDAGATEIVALLRELGAEKPVGLEIPRGTDVHILQGKAIAEGSTGILATALKAVQAVAGFTPWNIVVDDRGAETFVVITRNGRSWDSAVTQAQPFGADGPKVDTRKMAAAVILLAVSRGYSKGDFDALAGATDWRSLGWQYVSATDKTLKHDARLWLLNEAIELDPGNHPAQLAFAHETYRNSTTKAGLWEYYSWLKSYPGKDNLAAALRLRMAYNMLVAAANHCAAKGFEGHEGTAPADDPTRDAATYLRTVLDSTDKDEDVKELRAEMVDAASSLLRYAKDRTFPRSMRPAHTSPTKTYNWVCCEAVVNGPSDDLVEVLASNLATPAAVEWAWDDPMLKRVAAMPAFRKKFGKPPRSMLEIEPFKAYAEPLKGAHLDNPALLVAPTMTPKRLGKHLSVEPQVAGLLQASARLALKVPDKLEAHRFEILTALRDVGIASRRDLRRTPLSKNRLADAIAASVAKRKCSAPEREDVLTWLGKVKARPARKHHIDE